MAEKIDKELPQVLREGIASSLILFEAVLHAIKDNLGFLGEEFSRILAMNLICAMARPVPDISNMVTAIVNQAMANNAASLLGRLRR